MPVAAVIVVGVALAVALWRTPAPERVAAPDPLVLAAKPLAVGEVANFILYDVPEQIGRAHV